MHTDHLANACTSAAFGFDLCARRTSDPRVAVAVKSAAKNLRSLAAASSKKEEEEPAKLKMRDRLRWEWLASTATAMDGGAEARLLEECSSILRSALRATESSTDDPVYARFRVASAEAWSLAFCVAPARMRSLEAFA